MLSQHSSPRLALLVATGATALAAAAFTAAPAHAEGNRVIGSVASVTSSTIEVNQAAGTAKVEVTPTTTVSESLPAQRGELTVGSCIKAGSGDGQTGTAITAKWVSISTAADGKCPQRSGNAGQPPAGAQHHGVRGVVNAVNGDTVTLTRGDGSEATVTLTDATRYHRRVPSTAGAITTGKCLAARGDLDGSGTLQATRAIFWTPTDGTCPQPGN